MPRSIRDVARLLLLAGGAGLPAVSLAANPPTPPSAVVHVSPDQLRSEAMRVELAWLADPNLYQLPLTVRVKDQALEVSGQVPDEQVHQWVLQTSRQSCYLPIHDALTVSVVQHTSVPKEQLLATAREALVRHLAGRAAGMQAAATEDGQVVLRGEVPTLADKLTASRALRGLPGCSRVVNRLTVGSVAPEPQPQPPAIQQVKASLAPGEHTGGSAPPVPLVDDAIPVPQVQHAPTTPYVAPPDAATLPSGLPAVRYQVLDHGYGPQLVRIEASTPPPPVVQSTVVRREIVTEAKPPLRERLLNGWRTPPRPTVKPGGTTPPATVVATPPAPAGATPFQPVVTPVSTASAPPPAKVVDPPVAAPATVWPPAHHIRPAVATNFHPSRPLARLVQANNPPAPTVAPPSQPAVAATPPASAPVKPVAATEQPGTLVQPATVKAAASVAVSQPPAPPISIKPADLQRMVARVGGKLLTRVEVEATGSGYVVHVHPRQTTEHELLPVLLQLPELAASNVQLNVHLAP